MTTLTHGLHLAMVQVKKWVRDLISVMKDGIDSPGLRGCKSEAFTTISEPTSDISGGGYLYVRLSFI